MKELYIDFDGVILDTIERSYKLLEEKKIDKTNKDEVTKFFEGLNWEIFISESPQINDSINCITKIINSNRFRVSILTHINSLDEAIEKIKYIRNYFKDITVIPVPKKISKTRMVHTKDAILIDDYSENLKEWEEEGGIGIRFNRNLEDKGFRVIDKLDQILDMDI